MSSGIICKIKLELFYQEFLRGMYVCYDPIFSFPEFNSRDLIMYQFYRQLRPKPVKQRTFPNSEEVFMIEVPRVDITDTSVPQKHPEYYNYIPEIGEELVFKTIETHFRFVFTEHVESYMTEIKNRLPEGKILSNKLKKRQYDDAVKDFMSKYNISEQYFDRLIKDFSRLRVCLRRQKFRQKSYTLNHPEISY